jgi:methionyl-tRNA formyltransferase
MTNNLRIAFFGTPELTIPILEELKNTGYTPVVIVTGMDKPVGRKMTITPPEPKKWAEANGILISQPNKLDPEFITEFRKLNIDLSIVVAYGKIIPEELINIPRFGTINIHYSLLPKYRGATPVEAAILNGEIETGVCIQHMRYKLDSGPIIKMEKVAIDSADTAEELRNKLNTIGKKLLVESIEELISGNAKMIEQDETQATFCKKIKKEDGEINLDDNETINYNKFRAYNKWPRTYFFVEKHGQRIRVIITKAKTENNAFVIERVIPEGKKEISYSEFVKTI